MAQPWPDSWCCQEIRDAMFSFEKALEFDPLCVEAYDELSDYHDGIRDDPATAMRF